MTNRNDRIEGVLDDVATLWRRLKLAMRAEASNQGVPQSQLEVLVHVGHNQPVSVKDIAAGMHVSGSAATQLIEALAGESLVTRQPSSEDRRVTLVSLTPTGQDRLRTLHALRRQHVFPILDSLTDAELDELGRLHRKMLGRLDDSADATAEARDAA